MLPAVQIELRSLNGCISLSTHAHTGSGTVCVLIADGGGNAPIEINPVRATDFDLCVLYCRCLLNLSDGRVVCWFWSLERACDNVTFLLARCPTSAYWVTQAIFINGNGVFWHHDVMSTHILFLLSSYSYAICCMCRLLLCALQFYIFLSFVLAPCFKVCGFIVLTIQQLMTLKHHLFLCRVDDGAHDEAYCLEPLQVATRS